MISGHGEGSCANINVSSAKLILDSPEASGFREGRMMWVSWPILSTPMDLCFHEGSVETPGLSSSQDLGVEGLFYPDTMWECLDPKLSH